MIKAAPSASVHSIRRR